MQTEIDQAYREAFAEERQKAYREGVLEVRRRNARILRSKAAQGREEQAIRLALDTDIPAEQAIKVLESAPLDAERGKMEITDAAAAEAWAKALANIQ